MTVDTLAISSEPTSLIAEDRAIPSEDLSRAAQDERTIAEDVRLSVELEPTIEEEERSGVETRRIPRRMSAGAWGDERRPRQAVRRLPKAKRRTSRTMREPLSTRPKTTELIAIASTLDDSLLAGARPDAKGGSCSPRVTTDTGGRCRETAHAHRQRKWTCRREACGAPRNRATVDHALRGGGRVHTGGPVDGTGDERAPASDSAPCRGCWPGEGHRAGCAQSEPHARQAFYVDFTSPDWPTSADSDHAHDTHPCCASPRLYI